MAPGISTLHSPLLTRKEAAAFLGVSLTTVAQLLAEGALGAYRVRRCIRIPQSSLEAYLAAREV